MTAYRWINLLLAFLLELVALVALGYWGFHIGTSTALHVVLGIGLPVLAAVLWWLFAAAGGARFAVPGWFKIFVKTIVYAAATFGLYLTGHRVLGAVFALVVIVNATLIRVGHLDAGIGKKPVR